MRRLFAIHVEIMMLYGCYLTRIGTNDVGECAVAVGGDESGTVPENTGRVEGNGVCIVHNYVV